ncbi:MAG: cache domain-containing protein [Deltaproteobacteria bacterium]|nr:cache domain-containing protein [Deltaproteobacteria bacterium]MBW1816231.1 cache domain-containing protein [Deltaproteobacteria bacterium]MBW2283033.1 cache domain-containing protein [Deltaproteobacteria bacterium]
MLRRKRSLKALNALLAAVFCVWVCAATAVAGNDTGNTVQLAQAEKEPKKPSRAEADMKKQMTKIMDQVFMVLNTVMSMEGLSDAEKRDRAYEFLRTFRYGEEGKGYIVAVSLAGVIQVEPNILELVGKDLRSLEDPNGIKVFEAFTRICLEQGQGWTTYLWPKSGNKEWHVPTVGLVRYFEPLGLAVVTSYTPINIDVQDMGTPYIDDQATASPT